MGTIVDEHISQYEYNKILQFRKFLKWSIQEIQENFKTSSTWIKTLTNSLNNSCNFYNVIHVIFAFRLGFVADV